MTTPSLPDTAAGVDSVVGLLAGSTVPGNGSPIDSISGVDTLPGLFAGAATTNSATGPADGAFGTDNLAGLFAGSAANQFQNGPADNASGFDGLAGVTASTSGPSGGFFSPIDGFSISDSFPIVGTNALFGGGANDNVVWTDDLPYAGMPAGFSFATPPDDRVFFTDDLTVISRTFPVADTGSFTDVLGLRFNASATFVGRTAVTVTGLVFGEYIATGFTAAGGTVFSVSYLLDGSPHTGFIAAGSTAVSVTPVGALQGSFEVDGATGVSLTLAGAQSHSLLFAGSTRFSILFTPDMNDNPPIGLGVELSGDFQLTAVSS